jgi:hypothetical protein
LPRCGHSSYIAPAYVKSPEKTGCRCFNETLRYSETIISPIIYTGNNGITYVATNTVDIMTKIT